LTVGGEGEEVCAGLARTELEGEGRGDGVEAESRELTSVDVEAECWRRAWEEARCRYVSRS
jgi:hypothetical protein